MGRLVKVGREDLTIGRRRKGKGFSYVDSDGAVVADADMRERIRALGIPPAWSEVHIAASTLAETL